MDQCDGPDDLSPAPPISAIGQVPSAGVTGATATITLPQLWLADPTLWFTQAENKSRIHRVTSEVGKYERLLEALPLQAVAEIRHILVRPIDETPYTTIKETLLRLLGPPAHRRIQQLLNNEDIGDRRPTQFLRHLQHLTGNQ